MPWKLFFPRNRASSYERKSHVLRANERVAWVEQRNFAVFTRYPLRESRPHPSPSINFRSPSRGRDGFPNLLSSFLSNIALFSSVSSSMRGNVSLSLSLHQRSATTVNHVALCRGNEIYWRRDIESREPREIWNWSMEGKKSGKKSRLEERNVSKFRFPPPPPLRLCPRRYRGAC